MALLNENIQKQLKQVFADMNGPVKLVFFAQASDGMSALESQVCSDMRQLMEEVSALSEKIRLEEFDLVKDAAVAKQYTVDKIPALVILGGTDYKDYGIRMYGIPSGYEFGTLIEDIMLASRGTPNLKPKTLDALGKLKRPVHIQVYVTPT